MKKEAQMLKVDKETLDRMEKGYPGILKDILYFEEANLPACPRCASDDTANVQCGIIGRTINIVGATTKFTLIPGGPKPGRYRCNACKEYFNAVPDFQQFMYPLLRCAGETIDDMSTDEAVDSLAKKFCLNEEELKETLPGGIESVFVSRVGMALIYMYQAGLLKFTERGHYQITTRGRALLSEQPAFINMKLLKQYPEFIEFMRLEKKAKDMGMDT
jgi:hypothetical protein